ncbi:SIMPL domain-containing protein [Pseudodesulfovibrio senegalensis]|jgi:hypothetical protein|uniref:SIMPL domain-containing protein n=1 Tax=Pseudodesulfovibrio senegalensis TaxID=1721087 RepID=A0A6N6N5P0_9BACT|nr:SIMPL domain-containing protein [Pseudodesulfovibrio senegalensis]KAB1443061.1 SIMPL domain-containing protein [Pseudodesulfovibrio senegalensis]
MNENRSIHLVLAALVLGAGIAAGCALLGNAVTNFKAMDRYVTVKGFCEREYPADLAIWPISFRSTADDLRELQAKLESSSKTIMAFLEEKGLGDAEITPSAPLISENMYPQHNPGMPRPPRYTGQGIITVRSKDIRLVKKTMTQSGELVSRGVMMVRNYEFQPRFMYTGLETIKPEMIAEATRDARRAARQFAEDSGSSVGNIRRARQGMFSISNRDQYTPEIKRVRVVNTVEYFLKD